MTEQQQANALTATFPAPPLFWQSFSPENLNRIAELRGQAPKSDPPQALIDLPQELRWLQPPNPPSDGKYRCFGFDYNLNEDLPSLEEQGIQQLYTPPTTPTGGRHSDRALVLKRIAKSLLLNFLELIGIMSVDPEQYAEKIQDLRTLFINFHHLLNEYRPHQARESLILMMQDQLDQTRAETEKMLQMRDKVENLLQGLGQAKLADEEQPRSQQPDTEFLEGKDVWDELVKEFG